MEKSIFVHLDRALNSYTNEEYRDTLIEAKNDFFKITGNINEDDDDYDLRMHSFNDWYLTQFCLPREKRTPIADYILKEDVEEDVANVLLNVKQSIFQFTGEKRNGAAIFKNLKEGRKLVVKDKTIAPMFLKGDIFLARYYEFPKEVVFLPGVCVLPIEVKKVICSALKKVGFTKSKRDEQNLLLKMEYLKTKSKRYSHLAIDKIFTF